MIPRPSGRSSTEISAQTGTRTGKDREHPGILFALFRSLSLSSLFLSSFFTFFCFFCSCDYSFRDILSLIDWIQLYFLWYSLFSQPKMCGALITHCHIAYPGILQTSIIFNMVQPRFSSPHWMVGFEWDISFFSSSSFFLLLFSFLHSFILSLLCFGDLENGYFILPSLMLGSDLILQENSFCIRSRYTWAFLTRRW